MIGVEYTRTLYIYIERERERDVDKDHIVISIWQGKLESKCIKIGNAIKTPLAQR